MDSQLAKRRTSLICLFLSALSLLTFWPVTGNNFISFDDTAYITENSQVLTGLTWENVKWAFTTGHFGNWHPLTWLSHMLDVQLFGLNPGLHHLHSLGLHTGSVIILFLALRRLNLAELPSAWVAALFAVHPLRVESIAWASERKDVLSVFFGMLSLYAYAWYVAARGQRLKPDQSGVDAGPTHPPPTSKFSVKPSPGLLYGIALGSFALALMSKAMMVTLPFVMLLLDYWPLRRGEGNGESTKEDAGRWKGLTWEKAPFFALSVASTILGFALLRNIGSIASAATGLWDRLAYSAYGYQGYIAKMFWPVDLVLPYPRPARVPIGTVIAIPLVIGLVSVCAIMQRKSRPYFAVGWFWFLGALLPVSGIFQLGVQAMADRYTYFASIGLFLAATWGILELARRWRAGPAVAGAFGAIVLGSSVLASHRQTGYWHDSERLYRHALAASRDNFVAHNGLGWELFQQGMVEDAIRECQRAVEIDPRYDPAHSNLGRFLAEKQDYESAIRHCETAVKLSPRDAKSRNNLGNILLLQGRTQEAFDQFTEVVRLNPGHIEAQNNLALTCQKLGRHTEAILHFRKAIELAPDFLAALNNLAWTLATNPESQFRDGREAVELASRACVLTQYQHPNTLATLAAAYAELGQFSDAIAFVEQARERTSASNPLMDRLDVMLQFFRAGKPFRAD